MSIKNFQIKNGLSVNGQEVIDGNANGDFTSVIISGIDILEYTQEAYNQANTVNNTANTAQSAFNTANGANGLAAGAFNQANTTAGGLLTANSNISIIQGVDVTQNTRLNAIETINTNQNTSISIIQGVDNTQNTRLNSIETVNQNQNTSISIIEGVNLTQNTRLNSIETVNQDQNTAIGIVQGVDLAQNTRMSIIEGVDATQNVRLNSIETINQNQNTTITQVNQFAQSAHDHANTKFASAGGTITGPVVISGNNNLTVTGNLNVLGTTTTVNTNLLEVNDPMILLANGNFYSDTLDIGFAAHYNDGANAHTGLFREHANKDWYLFQGYTPEVSGNNDINISDPSFRTANLNADYVKANVIATTAVIGGINFANYISLVSGIDATQNTRIGGIEGVDLTQNTRLNSIETVNVDQNTAISIIQGTDATQNVRLNSIETINSDQNTAISIIQGVNLSQNAEIAIIQGVDLAQNTRITEVNQYAASGYATANSAQANTILTQGVDATQNVRLSSIETINTNQNNSITIIQGVDLTQNTNITAVNNYAVSAYNQANTNATNITTVNQFASSAYNTANDGITLAQAAFNQGNSTATVANTDYTTILVTAATYGNATSIPSFTLAANGRITSVTNTAISGGGATITDDTSTNAIRFVLFDDATSGTLSTVNTSSTKLTFNPSVGTLSANGINTQSLLVNNSPYINSNRTITNYGITTNVLNSGSGSRTINLTLGNFVTATVAGATTWIFSNPLPSPNACGFVLELTNGGSATQTWPVTVRWPGGTAPTLTSSGVDVLAFITDDGGTNWRGVASMLDSK